MARTIDADALYRRVKAECNPYGKPSIGWEDGQRMMQWIEQAPTIGGWISVKDRLPEYVGWYLVSLVNNRNGHRWKTPVVCEYSLDVWHEKDLFSNDVDATVTHWMYLPEPPEEVSGDEG